FSPNRDCGRRVCVAFWREQHAPRTGDRGAGSRAGRSVSNATRLRVDGRHRAEVASQDRAARGRLSYRGERDGKPNSSAVSGRLARVDVWMFTFSAQARYPTDKLPPATRPDRIPTRFTIG